MGWAWWSSAATTVGLLLGVMDRARYLINISIFLGHRQTVQTQIRRRRTQRLIRVFTVCLQGFLFQIE